jgi:hypothetical protein
MLEMGIRKPGRELSLRIARVARIPVKAWEESSSQ